MLYDLDNLRLPPGSNLSIEPLTQVKTTSDQLPSPSFISYAMVPEVVSRKGRVGIGRVSDKASRGMSVHRQEKGDEQVMRIPERLIALLSDLRMRSREHEQHAQ